MASPEHPRDSFSFNPLWKTLIDKGMKRGDLCAAAHLARATVTKMGKNEAVSLKVVSRICRALRVPVDHVLEISFETEWEEQSSHENQP